MSGKLPRLCVSITSEQHSLLLKLAALEGRSAASYLRQMLDVATPMLEATLPVLEAAAKQAAMQPHALAEAIKNALLEVDAQKAQLSLLGLLAASPLDPANDEPSPGQTTTASSASEDFDLAKAPKRRRRS